MNTNLQNVNVQDLQQLKETSCSERFKAIYRDFNHKTIASLDTIYADNVIFEDPISRIQGVGALKSHFESTLNGLVHCSFIFDKEFNAHASYCYEWRMNFAHEKIRSGEDLILHGSSVVVFNENGKVVSHRDYYDMGEMLYENIPVLGSIVRFIKQKLSPKP